MKTNEIATAEAVRKAAEELSKEMPPEGIKAGHIRERIGGGSFTTINKRLADWREELKAREEFKRSVPAMPDEVTGLWERIWLLADEQHRATRDSWLEEKRNLMAEIEERNTEISRLEQEGEELKEQLVEANERLSEAENATTRAERDRDLAVTRAETLKEQHEKMIERLSTRLEEPIAMPEGKRPTTSRQRQPKG